MASHQDKQRRAELALSCFVAGAVGASMVDHFVGTVDRTNIRLVYFVVGASLMLGSYLWRRGLHAMAG